MRERLEHSEESATVTAPVDTVWGALKASLDALGVPISFSDRSSWQMGSVRAKLYHYLGKQSVSTYLRCGEGMTGPNADTYAVYLSYVAFLQPASDGKVTLLSLVTAQAVDLANGRGDPVDCTSNGRLEQRIAQQVQARVLLPAKPK